MTEPWEHEPDYWSTRVGDIHLIAVRDPRHRYWNGYVGIHQRSWEAIDTAKLKLHHDPTFFGTRDRFGGRPGFFYIGFDCHRMTPGPDGFHDYSPEDFRSNAKRVDGGMYRPLTFVQLVCYQAARDIQDQRAWWRRLWRALKGHAAGWWRRMRTCKVCGGTGIVVVNWGIETACSRCCKTEDRPAAN